jgi:dihydrolipoamide dehydrogenase
MVEEFDSIVIGGGPGGYVAAIRAAQLGMNTALVERERLGGVCLNWGCIPTKALLKSAEVINIMKRGNEFGVAAESITMNFPAVIERSRRVAEKMSKGVEYLIRRNNIKLFSGTGKFEDAQTVRITDSVQRTKVIGGKHIILATGGRPHPLPGLDFDGKYIISSKEAMIPESVPESIVIVGAGAIGVEFAYFYASFGSTVTIIEMLPQLLPTADPEISQTVTKSFEKMGITVIAGAKVEHARKHEQGIEVKVVKNNEINTIRADRLLIAIGIRPNTEQIGLEELGVVTERGFIKVDLHFQTSLPGIYAIGDCIGGILLAHVASAEGITCVEHIAGHSNAGVDYSAVPFCIYSSPQAASLGLTEQQSLDAGYTVKVGKYPFRANGKSVAAGEIEGFVKLIFEANTGELLGAHIVGLEAPEMIAELALAKSLKATYKDIHTTVHAHPTLSECIMEAAGQAFGQAIHI